MEVKEKLTVVMPLSRIALKQNSRKEAGKLKVLRTEGLYILRTSLVKRCKLVGAAKTSGVQ
jgi:hypothetical protein